MAGLVLDTAVLIANERRGDALDDVLGDEDDVVLAAVTAAELLVGVELADGRRREQRKAFVEALLEAFPVEAYDLEIARAHAELLAHVRSRGHARGAHDLMIAATARARSRTVVTADARGFSDLPGVELRILT